MNEILCQKSSTQGCQTEHAVQNGGQRARLPHCFGRRARVPSKGMAGLYPLPAVRSHRPIFSNALNHQAYPPVAFRRAGMVRSDAPTQGELSVTFV
eukprot:COSAG05_NODE_14438_length_396_cov_1.397306_1_plen_95_part_10